MTGTPFIEVIVPAYNEAENIEACLDSLLKQKSSRTYGILVVDDGSTDRTPEILSRYESDHDKLRVVKKETNRGYGDTIERGFKEARADIICFVDGDSVMNSGSLAAIIEDYESGADAVFGYVDVKNDHRLHGLYCRVGKRLNPNSRYGGACMSFRRDVLSDVGGFLDVQNRGGHDVEIKARLKKSDYDVVFDDSAKVYSRFPEGWQSVLRQKYLAGKTHIIHSNQHPEQFDPRVLANSGFYVALLLTVVVSLFMPLATIGVIGLLGIFVHEHWPRAREMYRASGSPKMGLLYFPYALAAGYLRTAGYLSEWQTLLALLVENKRDSKISEP